MEYNVDANHRSLDGIEVTNVADDAIDTNRLLPRGDPVEAGDNSLLLCQEADDV